MSLAVERNQNRRTVKLADDPVARGTPPEVTTRPVVDQDKYEKKNTVTAAQREIMDRTGIPEYRFDPAWWKNDNYGKAGSPARPPDKVIWDSWTPEQRAAAGLPTWTEYKQATLAWRNHIREHDAQKDREIVQKAKELGLDLTKEADFIKAMNAAGIFDRPEEGRAGFRRRLGAFRGDMDGSGRYHFTGDGRVVDVATSDLRIRGIPMHRPDIRRATGPAAALGEAYAG